MSILALDQGTTSTRALLFGPDGRGTVLHHLEHRQIYPSPGYVEHDPEELVRHLGACLEAAAGTPELAAIGLTNQGESCLAWDAETGAALSPVIVWQDERTARDTDRLRTQGVEPLVRARTGLPLDPYFSASKLAWLYRTVPDAQALAAQGRLRLGTTDAFFRQRLTGRCETDVATASRTSLMSLDTCQWDAELCRLFGVPMEALAPIGPTGGDLGAVDVGTRMVPLTASIVDQQAALYGHGCRAPGAGKMTFGTGAFALVVAGTSRPAASGGALPTIAWQAAGAAPIYALDGGVYAAAAAVNWARMLGLFHDFADINAFDAPPAIARGLAFVPALSGLACPHWQRGARGAWMGLALETDAADMMQAVLEGVAFRMVEVAQAMAGHQPLIGPVPIDGGMAANPYFCQTLADALGLDLRVPSEAEVTARGVAMLAAEAVGLHAPPVPDGRLIHSNGPLPADDYARFEQARSAVQRFAG